MSTFDWSRYAVGGATRPDSFTGMKPEFRSALEQLFTAAPPELGLQVGSGFRSVERQRQLWEASDKSGRMVARPGGSRHNHGDAADLSAAGARLDKASPAARQWVHDNAARYGLTFPMSYEPWHVELVGARGGKGLAPATATTSSAPAPGTNVAISQRALSPTPVAEQSGQALGDVVVAQPTPFGDLLARQAQSGQAARAEERAAQEARRTALLSGNLFGIYA